jgi:4-oxalocrotonate tautomerase
MARVINPEALAALPAPARGQVCICPACGARGAPPAPRPGASADAPGPIRFPLLFSATATISKEADMPTYHVEMMEGRTVEQKRKLVEEITRVSVEVLGGSPESVDILITDVKRENWATGGKLWSERS